MIKYVTILGLFFLVTSCSIPLKKAKDFIIKDYPIEIDSTEEDTYKNPI